MTGFIIGENSQEIEPVKSFLSDQFLAEIQNDIQIALCLTDFECYHNLVKQAMKIKLKMRESVKYDLKTRFSKDDEINYETYFDNIVNDFDLNSSEPSVYLINDAVYENIQGVEIYLRVMKYKK